MSNTPNMNLALPVPTVTAGPAWATAVNTAFDGVDSHDHTPGNGSLVPTAGLNINANLPLNSNKLTGATALQMVSQSSSLSGISNGNILESVNGDLWYVNSGGTPVQITTGATITSVASSSTPPGIVLPYAGTSAPTGYLMCDGTSYATASYGALFAITGYSYGGAGANFNVPNLVGRTAIGSGTYTDTVSGSITRTLAATHGAEKHVITTAESAVHDHGGGVHKHTIFGTTATEGSSTIVSAVPYIVESFIDSGLSTYRSDGITNDANTGIQNSASIISSVGSGTSHNNMQPSLVLNYIIKT